MQGCSLSLLTPVVCPRVPVGGGPSQSSPEDGGSVFPASAVLRQGCAHLCPSFLVVALNLVVALRTHVKLRATATPCFFSQEPLTNPDCLDALGQSICNTNPELHIYPLNYIMLILIHYSKLSVRP